MAVDAAAPTSPDAVAPIADVEGLTPDPARRLQLLDDCRELVVGRISRAIGEALRQLGDELTERALRSGRRDEQQALLDAVATVRQSRAQIETGFRSAFVDTFDRRLNRSAAPSVRQGAPAELTLVDDEATDARLSVDRLVTRARGKLDPDEVLGIRARLGALLERDWFDESGHPAAPEAVFEALRQALAQVAPSAPVRRALLDAFEPHISASLNPLYAAVNERLKAQRILPRIRPQAMVNPEARRRAGATDTAGAAVDPRADGHGDMRGTVRDGVNATAAARGLQAMLAGVGAGDATLAATLQQLAAGMPAARMSVARMLTDPAGFESAAGDLPSAGTGLLDAIGTLQAEHADHAPQAGTQLLAQLLDRSRDSGSPLDQLTVEIVSVVFDYIYADKRLSDVVKQQLLRLQVVAVKAALIDRSFFARRQHPMRRLLDRVTELATDPDADLSARSPLILGIEGLIDRILSEFDRDLQTFDQALERLEALAAAEQARRLARIESVTRRAERDELLQREGRRAAAMLEERMDADTPVFLREFLSGPWCRVTAVGGLDGEAAPLSAPDALKIAETLLWSVAPKTADEVPRLATMLPRLIQAMSKGLAAAPIADETRRAFFDELLAAHTGAVEAAKLGGGRPSQRATARIRMRPDGRIQFVAPRAAAMGTDAVPSAAPMRESAPDLAPVTLTLASGAREANANLDAGMSSAVQRIRAAEVQRGDRIEIDDGAEVLRFKLAWISPSRTLYVLSRFPDQARSLTAPELAAMFDAGRARVVERRSSIDQAIGMIAAAPGMVSTPRKPDVH